MACLPDIAVEFVVVAVADLPEMLDQERVKADNDCADKRYTAVDWKRVAAVSVRAVNEQSRWTVDEWCRYGRDHLAHAADQRGFEALFDHPICVGSAGYIEGRHRALFMIESGAAAFAVERL